MKKYFTVAIITLLVFSACDNNENNANKEQKTTLTITNSTDFNGVQPLYGEVDFGIMSRGQKVSKEVESGTNYVNIMFTHRPAASEILEHTSFYEMANVVVCMEKEDTKLTITNNSTITFLGGDTGYLDAGGARTGTLKSIFDAYIEYQRILGE